MNRPWLYCVLCFAVGCASGYALHVPGRKAPADPEQPYAITILLDDFRFAEMGASGRVRRDVYHFKTRKELDDAYNEASGPLIRHSNRKGD